MSSRRRAVLTVIGISLRLSAAHVFDRYRKVSCFSARPLAVPRQLLPEDTSNRRFERLRPRAGMLAERCVDQGLVTAAADGVSFPAEPRQHVVVEPNGDAGL